MMALSSNSFHPPIPPGPGLVPPASQGEGDAPHDAVRNTEFAFEHRVFALPSVVFREHPDQSGPAMYVDLDGVRGVVDTRALCDGFDIEPGSRDACLIALLPRALKYCREIRPGDSIPSEILDGRASWLAEKRYLDVAAARVSVQLVGWLRRQPIPAMSPTQIVMLSLDQATCQRMAGAHASLAAAIGDPADRRGEIGELIQRLSKELSYIEALRDRLLGGARAMMDELLRLQVEHRGDRPLLSEIERVNCLLGEPIRQIAEQFDGLDAQVADIVSTFRNLPARIAQIRQVRDRLRETHLVWEDVLGDWRELDPFQMTAVRRVVADSYRFAARRYPQGKRWALTLR